VKKRRSFGVPSNVSIIGVRTLDGQDQNIAIQQALDCLEFDPGSIDGIIGNNTRSAIRLYQDNIGAARTGTLTTAQIDLLLQKAGVSVASVTGAQGIITVTHYAVIDPYNLINEANEASNIWAFDVEVDGS
jgi:peptidoglycan hydrolase-like protein with peptidoglycan-binding domain